MQKIGIFGGSFDPIHIGHLFLAEAAYEKFGLDKVLFMPTPSPYHRTDKKVQPLEHRINMVKAAIEGNDHFEFSDFEIGLPGPTYTFNTLAEFKKAYPDAEIYLIIGGDSLFSIEKWREFEQIFRMATILSSKRDEESKGASGSLKPDQIRDQESGAEREGTDDMSDPLHDEFLAKAEQLRETYGARIFDVEMPNIQVSSGEISRRIKAGRSVRYYVTDPVFKYIKDNGLYNG